MKNEGSYEGFEGKIQGILSFLSPFAEIENGYSVFFTFLVLLGIGFIFGQFLKGISVLKSSEPQLSRGRIHFLFTLLFIYIMMQFSSFCLVSNQHFCLLDNNVESSRTPIIFHQFQLPGAVLNVELHELFKTVIGFKILRIIDGDIINQSNRAKQRF